jgi:uncharacterized protein (DUF983 family)
MQDDQIHAAAILARGLRRTCPHCGSGRMLDGWLATLDRCPNCGLVYQRNAGDTWAFWIIGDRIPVAIGIAAIYLGFKPHTWIEATLFFGALGVLLIATIPHRMGLVVALHYLTRRYWPDPDDAVPPISLSS